MTMPAITEKQFEGQVKDLAKMFGWKYYHTWRSIHSPAGFPDVVMIRNGTLLFAELKSEKGKLSEKQEEWIDALKGIARNSLGVQVFVWYPRDFDEIVGVLR